MLRFLGRPLRDAVRPQRVLQGKSLIASIQQTAEPKIKLGRLLEISGVCGGIWVCASQIPPVTSVFLLALLATHLNVSEKIRKFLFFGVLARNVVAVDVLEEQPDRLQLDIFTDAGKRRLTLVLDSVVPENAERILFRDLVDLGTLRFPTSADAEDARILERLTTENLVIIEEESEISNPENHKAFRLSDVNKEKLKALQKRIPRWLKDKLTGEEILEKQANQQLFLGALTVGIASVLTVRTLSTAEPHSPAVVSHSE